jgi:hypothetical protein
MDKFYVETVRLLLEVAPVVFTQADFAMKGGTAINLFVDNMPRLSVDIDVVYTDFQRPREAALQAISSGLQNIQGILAGRGLEAEIISTTTGEDIRMFVRRRPVLVKIEVNHVFRGTVLPIAARHLSAEAGSAFATNISAPILAPPELYGSKLVAALDRQHPRDFFDVRGMYQQDGLTPEIVECFVCYLAGHNRPVHEVLFSRDLDMAPAFQNEFIGMTREPVTLDELVEVRRRLRQDLPSSLTAKHRQFLLSLVAGEPDWSLMQCPHLKDLPAIRWKLQNLAKLKKSNDRKFAEQTDELRARLNL